MDFDLNWLTIWTHQFKEIVQEFLRDSLKSFRNISKASYSDVWSKCSVVLTILRSCLKSRLYSHAKSLLREEKINDFMNSKKIRWNLMSEQTLIFFYIKVRAFTVPFFHNQEFQRLCSIEKLKFLIHWVRLVRYEVWQAAYELGRYEGLLSYVSMNCCLVR